HVMRQQAHKAGHLNSNEQEKITAQGNTIIIEPANPEVVTFPRTILGSCTATRSLHIQAGIPYRGSFLEGLQSRSGLDLESASSGDLDGAGITGDAIGRATG